MFRKVIKNYLFLSILNLTASFVCAVTMCILLVNTFSIGVLALIVLSVFCTFMNAACFFIYFEKYMTNSQKNMK